jgi:hypothetical protein
MALRSGRTAEGPYGHLVGHRFPGARITLPEYVSWLWADAVGGTPDREVAHPSVAYLVAMQGTGVRVRDIIELMGATPEDGVLLGENEIALAGTLTPGASYDCDGEVIAIERKQGARAGVFDKFTFQVRVREPGGGEAVATCTYTWIFPRRDG